MTEGIDTKISQYLEEYGWNYLKEGSDFITMFRSEKSDYEFRLAIRPTEYWIGLTIFPFLCPIEKDKELDLLKLICRKNCDVKLARIALTDAGETLICIDIHRDQLSQNSFNMALDIITYYAENLFDEFIKYWEQG